jgi:hypothetical protein
MSKKSKTRPCKACGHEISAKGKVKCPSCGAINKSPLYKRPWFIVLVIIVLFIMIPSGSSDGSAASSTGNSTSSSTESTKPSKTEPQEEISYLEVTAGELVEALDSNALKASNTYDDQYIKLVGVVSNIDAQGKYFSVNPVDNEFNFTSLRCDISSDHKDIVANFSDGQPITVYGKVTDVGEVFGYSIDVIEIELDGNTPTTAVTTIKSDDDGPVFIEVETLVEDLEENALKASKLYDNAYVTLKGSVANIDAQGDYFTLEPANGTFTMTNVMCKISSEFIDQVSELNTDQVVMVTGTITDVGEIFGYTLKVESIE